MRKPVISGREIMRTTIVTETRNRVVPQADGSLVVKREQVVTRVPYVFRTELVSRVPYRRGARRRIVAEPGAFQLVGMSVLLRKSSVLVAAGGAYALVGEAADLVAARTMPGEPGAYVLGGIDAGGVASRRMAAEAGAYAMAGQDAALGIVRALSAEAGSYAVTGEPVGLSVSRRIPAAAGSYALAGGDAGLRAERFLEADPGAFTLAGNGAAMVAARFLAAEAGAYAVTGQPAGLRASRRLAAEAGAYGVTGQNAGLRASRRMSAGTGAYSVGGQNAALIYVPFFTAGLDNLYAAHGTALLVSGYTGPLVRLRRNSDNAEQDFSPVDGNANANLDAAAITSWLAGSTALVTTLYDQTGNGRDAVQTTAGNQPALNMSLSFPFLEFDGAGDGFNLPNMVGFARNVGAVSAVVVRAMLGSGAQKNLFVFLTAGGSGRFAVRRDSGTPGNFQIIGRRLDADGGSTVGNIAANNNWATEVAVADYTNSDAYHRVAATEANTTSFSTAGTSSDTDGVARIVTNNGSDGMNGYATAFVWTRDVLDGTERATMVARGSLLVPS